MQSQARSDNRVWYAFPHILPQSPISHDGRIVLQLRGATALITGGAQRVGRHIALGLADAGANVVLTYFHSGRRAQKTLGEVLARGVQGLALQVDAADGNQVSHMLDSLGKRFVRLDLWVANAGAFRRTPLTSVTEHDWDDMMRANFQTLLTPAQRIGDLMQRQGSGCIISLTDVAGIRPWPDFIPYCVAKSCVLALTRRLAVELAPAVRVNAIAPGPILFPQGFDSTARQREIGRTLLRRQGKPQHVSDAVLNLARNDYVTGIVLPVDGGRLLD